MRNMVLKEQAGARAEKFARAIEKSRQQLDKLTRSGARNVEKLIRELRNEVRSRLISFSPVDSAAPFLVRELPAIASEIDGALEVLSRQAKREINERMADAFETGSGRYHHWGVES